MALRRINPLLLLAAALVFAASLALFNAINRPGAPALGGDSISIGHARTTDQQIAVLQKVVRDHPSDSNEYALLADAYLQKVRETGDASFYTRAGGILARARVLGPRNPAVYTELGTLALARHDFRGGLTLGRRALALDPTAVRPLGVIADAQVELGRYRDAGRTLQTMLDEKPSLASYSRVSYFRELHGDLDGAVRAMQLAVAAGGAAPENVAYVQTLLGQLEFARGRLAAASHAYRAALYSFPGYPAALAGLGGVDAAQRRYPQAIARLRDVVDRLPLPQYVVALGDTELAAGRAAAARQDLALVGAEEDLLRANGVNTDTELALFEADHGSPARALVLARRAWAAAPSVRSADALGWALTKGGDPVAGLRWAHRALELGSRDPLFLYHAGIAAMGAGATAEARARLSAALALNPRFSPLYGPRAERALRSLP